MGTARHARVGPAATGLLVALLLAGCGSGDAVPSSTPLSDLGTQMSGPAQDTLSLVRDGTPGAKDQVTDDGGEDVSCDGGSRREYAASVTGPMGSVDEQAMRNRLNLITQAGLKKAGAEVTTAIGKSAADVPAELDFANKPSDEAQKRTYHTSLEVSGDTFTWKITGRTACVAKG